MQTISNGVRMGTSGAFSATLGYTGAFLLDKAFNVRLGLWKDVVENLLIYQALHLIGWNKTL